MLIALLLSGRRSRTTPPAPPPPPSLATSRHRHSHPPQHRRHHRHFTEPLSPSSSKSGRSKARATDVINSRSRISASHNKHACPPDAGARSHDARACTKPPATASAVRHFSSGQTCNSSSRRPKGPRPPEVDAKSVTTVPSKSLASG
ncbi:hypothetical protein GOP47_0009310 [Adiantum capillus-veneris]|uniref:Uncharacterized protein n=1 Tax=Adiantum capillus-veneris TaxID=13818 RepID=A0A9D4ZH37_ADICA|nr:hypothetical protein GOP47_0009310 [Adiantum capillus-veneris]